MYDNPELVIKIVKESAEYYLENISMEFYKNVLGNKLPLNMNIRDIFSNDESNILTRNGILTLRDLMSTEIDRIKALDSSTRENIRTTVYAIVKRTLNEMQEEKEEQKEQKNEEETRSVIEIANIDDVKMSDINAILESLKSQKEITIKLADKSEEEQER